MSALGSLRDHGDAWRRNTAAADPGGRADECALLDTLVDAIRRGESRSLVTVGSFSYMAFDIAALGLAFAAVGTVPAFSTLVLAYLIGQLGKPHTAARRSGRHRGSADWHLRVVRRQPG